MNRTRLIQRLEQPRGKDNPFSFGGGYKNGGLTDDAMEILRSVWSFDYMGAAEFEFGAVPKALNKIASNQADLVAFEFEVALSDVPSDWRDKSKGEPEGSETIYVLARSEDREEVEQRIRGWASEAYSNDLKEITRLSSTLRPYSEWDGDIVGWLELDNGFLFFTDKVMFDKTAALFGVES